MLTESRIEKVYFMIQDAKKLDAKIKAALGAKARKAKPNGSTTNGHTAKPSAKKVLQGKYLGAVRSLSKKDKKAVAKIRVENGYVRAISAAKKLAKES